MRTRRLVIWLVLQGCGGAPRDEDVSEQEVPRASPATVALAAVAVEADPLAPTTTPPEEATEPQAEEPEIAPPAEIWRYALSSKIRLRLTPSARGRQVGSVAHGARMRVLSESGDWIEVEGVTSGLRGWARRKDLAETRPPPPRVSDARFRRDAILEQIASYPGNCPCPYYTDAAGRSCGARSAYSKGGGYAPYCYPRDVPDDEVESRRAAHEASYYAE